MLSLTLLSFTPFALAMQVNVLHRIDVVRRQYGTCEPPLSACVAGVDSIGPYAACAPVCCFYSSTYVGGCQADSYCLVKGPKDYICCANGVASTACTPATACVNFGSPALSDVTACPSAAPICTTNSNGLAGCVGTGLVTGAGLPATAPSLPTAAGASFVLTETNLGEPNTLPGDVGTATQTDGGITEAGSLVEGPTGTDIVATGTGSGTEGTNGDPTVTGVPGPNATGTAMGIGASGTGTGTGVGATSLLGEPNTLPSALTGAPTDASGVTILPFTTLPGASGRLSTLVPGGENGSFTTTGPPAAPFTGAAALKGRIENASLAVAMLASLFAVLMG